MAILKSGIPFTGSVGNMSCYTRKDMEGVYIVRTKGGGSRKKIAKSPTCKAIRDNNADFGVSSKAGSNVRWMLTYLKHLADYNITPKLNSLSKIIQSYDKVNPKGKREVLFAKHRQLLNGFSLNNRYPLDGIVRHPLQCTINRTTCSAVVQFPDLIPGVNLFLPWKAPLYRFIISLGILTDNGAKPVQERTHRFVKRVYTAWQTAQIPFAAQQIEVKIENGYANEENQTLILSIGIEMGEPITNELIGIVKNTGSAKIVMVE
ncbi:hypothetical protein GO495_17430 [Chitinophaga oryziterrae]|uniref:Uncharacterized protein n=1 Tax=Chitinophaga oryziterrae TaxID=1031224 RepID=A0A6N8JDC1_9BACT|nr:hypothetical protein [Chitinophaga oryziterrae]MVT42378.1 hypothetical protein [Chitinophaga oryziterrae]